MAKLLGNRLPAAVLSVLAAEARRQPQGQCILLVTVDPDGNACPCVLSVGEILAVDDRTLRAVVWPGGRTTGNFDRGHPALFVFAAPPDVFYARAAPTRLPDAPNSSLARFTFARDLEFTAAEHAEIGTGAQRLITDRRSGVADQRAGGR
jgi:hypothetical protein